MFENMVASNARMRKPVGSAMMSIAVQAALVYGAVMATKGTAKTIDVMGGDGPIVFYPPNAPEPQPDQLPPEDILAANPPPKGFQTVVAMAKIPKEIPPVDLARKFNHEDFAGRGVEAGIAAGIVSGTGPVIKGEVFLAAELGDRPRLISIEEPRYPPVLESAGITGRVVLDFIVDTVGRVKRNSVKVINSTNKAFEKPALDALGTAVFSAGKVHGQPVQVLVRQAISFTQQTRRGGGINP